jgi:hypothetical protein
MNSLSRRFYVTGASGADDLRIGRRISTDTVDSDIVTITGGGNVGIGTTSPATTLSVNGGFAITGGTFPSSGSGLESWFDSTKVILQGYNRSGSSWLPVEINGSQLVFGASGSERARIDSSGRLLVGTSSAYTVQGFNRSHYFAPIAGENNNQMVVAGINTGTPALFFTRTRGGTPTTYTVVQDGDSLGLLEFYGADGTSYGSPGARIQASVDGTPGTNDMPGRLVLSTTSDGASSPTERLRVTSDGYVRLSSSSPGIQFGGDTAAANALDDYEEGTFTPTIVGTSTAGTATYAANGQVGRYTKIGNRVFFDLFLSWTAHTGTGDLQINGLPFTVQNTTNLNRNYSAILNVVAMTAGNLGAAFSSPNTTAVALRQMPTGGGSVATIPMDTSAQISISGCFEA